MVKFEDFDIVKRFEDKDKESILKYIRLVYDRKSSLLDIPILEDRKKRAAEMTKLTDESILKLENEKVNELIHAYLGLYQSSNKYYNYQANQQLFWDMQQMLMRQLSEGNKTTDEDVLLKRVKLRNDLSESTEKLLNRIDRQESEIFGGEQEQEMARQIIRKEIAIKSPEQRLKKMA